MALNTYGGFSQGFQQGFGLMESAQNRKLKEEQLENAEETQALAGTPGIVVLEIPEGFLGARRPNYLELLGVSWSSSRFLFSILFLT